MDVESILHQLHAIQEGRQQMNSEILMWRHRFLQTLEGVSEETQNKFMNVFAGYMVEYGPEKTIEQLTPPASPPETQTTENT